jgi:hypothetical protein
VPADVGGAPISDVAAISPQPLGSQIPAEAQAKPAPKVEPKSIDDSIDRAIAKSAEKAKEAPAKVEPKTDAKIDAKAEPKTEQPRENGKFAPKDPTAKVDPAKVEAKPSHTAGDPPARFTETAKAKWAAADPEIRGEVSRMERELTEGYQKHRAAAERDSTLNEFHEMAKQSGKDLPNVIREYVNMEQTLRADPVKGIETILSRVGISPRQYAEHILGQTPDQTASQQDATIRELKQEIASLKQEVGGVTQTFQQQRTEATTAEVTKFAADHPRFDELSEDIAFFLKTRTKDLSEAYTLAERLNPAPAQQASTTAASSAPVIDLHSAQPDKGSKSINGAPSSGASPAGKRRVALSIDDALSNAFGRAV